MLDKLANIFKKRKKYRDIDPDEIFIDSQNLPDYDIHQFEGRIEKPISTRTFWLIGVSFVLIGLICTGQVWHLEIAQGASFENKSETNRLENNTLFANRGVILDRNGVPLAWNDLNPDDSDFAARKYFPDAGISTTLGYVKYPAKDSSGNYYEKNFTPVEGMEKIYNSTLTGVNGTRLTETNVQGSVTSQSIIVPPQDGKILTLSIDSRIQKEAYDSMLDYAGRQGYQGGAMVIMNVANGEIIASANFPEYDANIMSDGSNAAKIKSYLTDKNNPFLNRVVTGLYTPGSVMKPYVALAALSEKTIDPSKVIVSTGSISVPNPYDPKHPSIFKDWKALGAVDMRHALAMSSDVYFYEVGGGFQNPGGSYQPGVGITNIEKYERIFGFGAKTGVNVPGEPNGVIPDPTWKAATFDGEPWRLGDTYNTSIGQYGVKITPLQAVRAVAAIANGGTLVTPQFLKSNPNQGISTIQTNMDPANIEIVKEGMRLAVTNGTVTSLNVSYVDASAKSGTAQIGLGNSNVNSWTIGFWPSDAPKYAFAIVMEKGPATETLGASLVVRELFDWMNQNTPNYFK